MTYELVPPIGPRNANIAIVGARPGYHEAQRGQPFIGESGELLWRLLGIPRSDVYVTNVRRDYSEAHSVPTDAEIREALPALRVELEQTRSNVIAVLGAEALKALSNFEKTSIDKWRGSIFESALVPGRKCVASYHPASALYVYHQRYIIEHDLRRVKSESKNPAISLPVREFLINIPFDLAVAHLRGLGDPITVDIETFANQISCVGIADSPYRALCVPFIGGHYTPSELAQLWREMDVVFRTRRVVGQNIQFDTLRLEKLGFRLNLHHDTMLSHHLLWTELGMRVKRKSGQRDVDSLSGKHSLAFITSIYTREPHYKHESEQAWSAPGLSNEERFHRYWTYNLKDVCTTHESYLGLDSELDRYKQRDYYNKHVMALVRPVMRMQSRGMLVDVPELDKFKRRQQLEAAVLQLELNQQVGFECNVRSGSQLSHLIHDVLHFPRAKRTAKGKPSTDEETLRAYAYSSDQHSKLFQLILDIRERRTLLSGFLNLELDEENVYRASYLLHGTDSGRLSSRAERKGPQLQNIPERAKRIFIARPGCTFINGDLVRAEAMYVAFDAQCKRLMELFSDARDLYSEVASEALGIPVSKHVNAWARQIFKRLVLGTNYRMGPIKLYRTLRASGVNLDDIDLPGKSPSGKAKWVQQLYLGKFPEIITWQKSIAARVRATRTLHDAFGRRRMFLGRLDDATINAACSYPPQATIVGISNQAIVHLDAQGWQIVSQTHDNVHLEVPIERFEEAKEALIRAMSIPITLHETTFTIPIEITWGRSWGGMSNAEGGIP